VSGAREAHEAHEAHGPHEGPGLERLPKAETVTVPPRSGLDVRFDIALFVMAFALRIAAGWQFAGESVWDGHYYDFYARRIAEGFGYTDPVSALGVTSMRASCHYPVGYSAVLGAFYWAMGPGTRTLVFFNALVGALLAVVVRACGAAALGRWRSRFGGVLVALHPGLVLYAALTMSETLSALCMFVALLASLSLRSASQSRLRILVPSFLVGLSMLVRPPALLILPWVLPWDQLRSVWQASDRGRFRRCVGKAGLMLALGFGVSLLPVLPWTARNCARMDGCALVSTNGGWNLAIGAFPRATGRFETLRGDDGCRDVTGQVQQDRCWLGVGLHYIKTDTLRWLSLVPKKWAQTFDHESFQIEYLHESKPAQWPDEKRAQGRTLLSTVHRLLCVAAALSFVRIPGRGARGKGFSILLWVLAVALLVLAWVGLSASEESVWLVLLLGGLVSCFVGVVGFVSVNGASTRESYAASGVGGGTGMAAPLSLRMLRSLGHDAPVTPWAIRQAWGVLATVFVTHAVFFGEDRYHIVATPALCLLAAALGRTHPSALTK
jgi:hypothetical protein